MWVDERGSGQEDRGSRNEDERGGGQDSRNDDEGEVDKRVGMRMKGEVDKKIEGVGMRMKGELDKRVGMRMKGRWTRKWNRVYRNEDVIWREIRRYT